MSRFHFHRLFKAITGVTPKVYAAAHRAQRARDELSQTDTVTEAIYGAKLNSNGRFYATSSEVLGMTPTNSALAVMGHPLLRHRRMFTVLNPGRRHR
jgi:AraC family transcriptional regulator, regulatory protein of adaptative response / methylated-DNA-[protein]-cysteine methyltransferase